MLPYKYTYLFGCMIFFFYWFGFYLAFPSKRKELVLISAAFSLIGLSTAYLFTGDWWRPETVLGGRLSIEDALLGFTNGGIAAFCAFLFHRESGAGKKIGRALMIMPFLTLFFLTSLLFFLMGLSSFIANALGLALATLIMLAIRPDLTSVSLIGGFLMAAFSFPVYSILVQVSPGWVEHSWIMGNLSGFMLGGVPIEDYVWYFLVGSFLSTAYPYLKNIAFEKRKRTVSMPKVLSIKRIS
jgi:hypothetical protein